MATHHGSSPFPSGPTFKVFHSSTTFNFLSWTPATDRTLTSKPSLHAGTETLSAALEGWLEAKHKKSLKAKTIECCEGYRRKLLEFFGDAKLLTDISAASLIAYQEWRSKTASHSAINHELNALSQVLRRAKLWDALGDDYAPLKEPYWQAPKTFTIKEQKAIFDYATCDPNVELAEIVAKITRNTTASGCELRGLRMENLELDADPPQVYIPPDATKNSVRPRSIPLNEEAVEAFTRAVKRANRLGSHAPHHYLFPFRINRKYWDPNRQASKSWLRKQFGKIREKTGIQHLRPHAFRHLAVTEMLEAGVPESTVIKVSGWVSRKMIDHYSHARMEAKVDAVNSLTPRRKRSTRMTNVVCIGSHRA
jgi:integrase